VDQPQQNVIGMIVAQSKIALANYGTQMQMDSQFTKFQDPEHPELNITTEMIATVPSLVAAGITLADITGAEYVIKMMKAQADLNLSALIALASL